MFRKEHEGITATLKAYENNRLGMPHLKTLTTLLIILICVVNM